MVSAKVRLETDQQHSTRCAIRQLPNRKAVDEGNCRSDETSVYWMSPARLRRADIFLTNAGEVGDGPDQGHSGGADSVPPAPNSQRLWLFQRKFGTAGDQKPAAAQLGFPRVPLCPPWFKFFRWTSTNQMSDYDISKTDIVFTNLKYGMFDRSIVHVFHIVGARPNFMKVAPVMSALKAHEHEGQTLVHTGQHYDANMSDVFFEQLGI